MEAIRPKTGRATHPLNYCTLLKYVLLPAYTTKSVAVAKKADRTANDMRSCELPKMPRLES